MDADAYKRRVAEEALLVRIFQRYGLCSTLFNGSIIAEHLARNSPDDVAAIRRTANYLQDRLFGRESELDYNDALITLSIVLAAVSMEPDLCTESQLAETLERVDAIDAEIKQRPQNKDFPFLVRHRPPRRANNTFICAAVRSW